jgi:ArsR family transcriptional regulator
MKNMARMFQLFSDETRLRILMLLAADELFVCQIMAVLGVSQPLVSRNLAMLRDAGILDERKDKKLVFYSLKKGLKGPASRVMNILKSELLDDDTFRRDREVLADCKEFQRRAGACDMKTFLEYMRKKTE